MARAASRRVLEQARISLEEPGHALVVGALRRRLGKGIAAGLAWQPVADAVVVYADHGVSAGMRTAIKAAHAAGMSVELRSLGSQP